MQQLLFAIVLVEITLFIPGEGNGVSRLAV